MFSKFSMKDKKRSPMFSKEDIHHIFTLINPEDVVASTAPGVHDHFPTLLVRSGGDVFIIRDYALRDFKSRVITATTRVSVANLSKELNVAESDILKFAEECHDCVLLSANDLEVVPKTQRDPVLSNLQELAACQLVSMTSFSQRNDISIKSLDALANGQPSDPLDALRKVDADHIASNQYFKLVQDTVQELLVSALKMIVPTRISPELIPGEPPIWLITKIVEEWTNIEGKDSPWRLESSANCITCIPRIYEAKRLSTNLDQLKTGEVPWIRLRPLSEEIRGLYPSLKDLKEYVRTDSDILIEDTVAISKSWIRKLKDECLQALRKDNFIDLRARVNDSFPAECQSKIFERVQSSIVESSKEDFPEEDPLYVLNNFILTSTGYRIHRDGLLVAADTHAQQEWDSLEGHPGKESQFRMSQILQLCSGNKPILSLMSEDKKMSKAIKERFICKLNSLESSNASVFKTFWDHHVDGRIQNYLDALDSINDPKLREELLSLVSDYVEKDLLPDAISKARAQGLVRTTSTIKQIQGLEHILSKEDIKLQDVIPSPEATLAEHVKKAMIGDLNRKMQKLSDPLRLFLILILVLLSEHKPGVVYATAKFAPRLLKQLKTSMDSEQYEQLQKWKDLVKAGKLSKEDIEGMKQLAADTVQPG